MITQMIVAAAFVAPAATARPESEGRPDAKMRHEICYVLATGTARFNLADCLSFDHAPEPVFRAEVCNFLRESEQLQDFGFAAHSQCLRDGFAR